MIIGVEPLLRLPEGLDRTGKSQGAQLEILGYGNTIALRLVAKNFSLSFQDGSGEVGIQREFASTSSLRELARILLNEADAIDARMRPSPKEIK